MSPQPSQSLPGSSLDEAFLTLGMGKSLMHNLGARDAEQQRLLSPFLSVCPTKPAEGSAQPVPGATHRPCQDALCRGDSKPQLRPCRGLYLMVLFASVVYSRCMASGLWKSFLFFIYQRFISLKCEWIETYTVSKCQ